MIRRIVAVKLCLVDSLNIRSSACTPASLKFLQIFLSVDRTGSAGGVVCDVDCPFAVQLSPIFVVASAAEKHIRKHLAFYHFPEVIQSGVSYFENSWLHPKKELPGITGIYVILQTRSLVNSYEEYSRHVSKGPNRRFQPPDNPGNEAYRWHGTSRACRIGELGIKKPCEELECGICGIIRTSFDLGYCGKATNWGRFGKGIYITEVSSKGDDYVWNEQDSSENALILATVVLGRPVVLRFNDDTLVKPYDGYDSVVGKPSKQGNLKYGESVVYNEDAIRPAYLVMYSSITANSCDDGWNSLEYSD